ncbi:protein BRASSINAZOLE-RESISTANT 1-like [Vicia villosa]|uniref:protein BRASSINAZOLE-RESISTANT 1-like n=1 Tax=Vicia villosa TaxID=3911 RepID=UPI00273B4DB1|nr:protein BRASSINAZOLE-RESISTANT 1-like [Vicia villosa]
MPAEGRAARRRRPERHRRGNCKPPLYNDAGTSTRTIPFTYSQNPTLVPPSFPTPIPSYQLTPMKFSSEMISNSAPVTSTVYPFGASSTPASPKHQNIDTPMKFQPFAQSPFKVPTTSSFKIFGVQVQPRIEKENQDERLIDLELTLGIGKGRD